MGSAGGCRSRLTSGISPVRCIAGYPGGLTAGSSAVRYSADPALCRDWLVSDRLGVLVGSGENCCQPGWRSRPVRRLLHPGAEASPVMPPTSAQQPAAIQPDQQRCCSNRKFAKKRDRQRQQHQPAASGGRHRRAELFCPCCRHRRQRLPHEHAEPRLKPISKIGLRTASTVPSLPGPVAGSASTHRSRPDAGLSISPESLRSWWRTECIGQAGQPVQMQAAGQRKRLCRAGWPVPPANGSTVLAGQISATGRRSSRPTSGNRACRIGQPFRQTGAAAV